MTTASDKTSANTPSVRAQARYPSTRWIR